MDRIIKRGRLVLLALLLVALLALYFVALYKLQIVEGTKYYELSRNSIVSTQTVTAARGNLMDRYGRVLVSNRSCNNLVIDTDDLFDQEDPNAVILALAEAIESTGAEYIDELPITMDPPFEYVSNMSDMDSWRLQKFLEDKEWDPNISAVELMAKFRTRYEIDPGYDARQMRIIAGVRYALNMHERVATSDYIFVEDAPIELITTLMENNIPGFDVEISYIREYKTQYAAHVLGYVNYIDDNDYDHFMDKGYPLDAVVGKDGAELAFEDYLHGVDGEAAVTRTAEGTVTGTVYTKVPEPGSHVYLTIDIGLQEVAENALAGHITQMNAQREISNAEAEMYGLTEDIQQLVTGGAVVAIDVDSGEPLCIANWPTFNLETFLEDYNEILEDKNNPLYNRALQGAYAPGSTFKPVTSLCALDMGLIDIYTSYTCQGIFDKYEDQGYAPKCWIYGAGLHGDLDVTHAIEHSCNYFFYTVADILESHGSINKLAEYAQGFGLGEYTGIELYEEKGAMATEEYKASLYEPGDFEGQWFTGNTLAAAIGQSISLFTPIQLANYAATLANGGTRYSTSVLKSVRSYDYSQTIYQREPEIMAVNDFDESYYEAVHRGMNLVVTSGNSPTVYQVFQGAEYSLAAKTGTAETGENQTNNATFICFAPYEDPEIAVAVVLEKGGAGSALAAIAREVLDYYFDFANSGVILENELELLR